VLWCCCGKQQGGKKLVNFRPLIIGLLLTGLFAVAFINGALLLASTNNAEQSIGDDPTLASYNASIRSALSDATGDAETSEEALSNSQITATGDTVFFDAIGGIWKTLKATPVTIYNLTAGLIINQILGSTLGLIVFGVIGTILTITIIFGVWKMVKTGESG